MKTHQPSGSEPAPAVPLNADEIRERMANVRLQIHQRSDDVVVQARELSDWRSYFRRHPWASVTAAAVIGYAIVPGQAKAGARASAPDSDKHAGAVAAGEMKSVLIAAGKRAAVTYAGRTLGDVIGGFFTADDEA